MKTSNKNKPFLIMSVYKDCLVAALDHISANKDETSAWARGLIQMLDAKKEKIPDRPSFSSLNELAQRLLEDEGIKKAPTK